MTVPVVQRITYILRIMVYTMDYRTQGHGTTLCHDSLLIGANCQNIQANMMATAIEGCA
jgi:hypothetical protein